MRTLFVFAFVLLLGPTASAATLNVEVSRQGFSGAIQVPWLRASTVRPPSGRRRKRSRPVARLP